MSAHDSLVEERLFRALGVTFVTFHGQIDLRGLERSDWASATFSGTRHRFRLSLNGAGAAGAMADFLASLPELDLPVPGRIVVDVALLAVERDSGALRAAAELEALLIEDR